MSAPYDNPFEVVVMDGGKVVARAEAETPGGALLAGQTLYDEALDNLTGAAAKLAVLFLANGKHVRTVTGERPR